MGHTLAYFSALVAILSLTGVCEVWSSSPYHGKFISDFTTLAHGVTGTVYAVDDHRIRIVGFNYDGAAPDAFFWGGTTDEPGSSGEVIPDEFGRTATKLGTYINRSITITLPDGKTINNYRWVSVWCRDFTVDFGHIYIPNNFDAPLEYDAGPFREYAHGLKGHVYITDSRTFRIENLHYDGNGPDAYFWVGTGSSPHRRGSKVPDENGSTRKLSGYNGDTISITMTSEMTVFDIDWLSMWCVAAVQNFGHVDIPDKSELNIPPYIDDSSDTSYDNCEVLNDNFHVSWTLEGSYIQIQLSGRVDRGEYLAFGLSGSDVGTVMIGSDVTVAWTDENNDAFAVDYSLTAYGQCSVGYGACPDAEADGVDDVYDSFAVITDGITRIGFTRQLDTGDSVDNAIPSDGEVYISWAIGLINPNGLAAKHHTVPSGNVKLNFGRVNSDNCPSFPDTTLKPVTPWEEVCLDGDEDNTVFRVRIGQAGGRRGYTAITGLVSWGIAWYINETLIPVLRLKRGVNYTFIIEGGDDPMQSASYHPFYITDDPVGGYVQKSQEEREQVKVYAGVEFENGNPSPTAAGRYCEYKTTGVDQSEESETFEDYFKTLKLDCEEGAPGELLWTPDENTPDTVYYQCYTHQYLGWKITFNDAAGIYLTSASHNIVLSILILICIWIV
ncbi:protein Skeletor, isoforms B/C-like [Saccoglossus kowalevskii]|uniref:Protein Skeletor, isoforms D/E-like n=1 Tax=Saccoglossus kowalevskii TaxID=10224 RepID=A0ABM0M621_SACKO|nr:PREDICTED: protein Skeletor, isoforms D/E-like [Saccoglossus kowalevskii]